MHCTDPQGSLYIWTAQINSIPEIWPTWAILHITSLISLCNFFSVLDTSRFFHCWHVCFLFFIPLLFFFVVRHSSNDQHWKNTYHCAWNIYGQSTFSRLFLDSIGMLDLIPYSFIINYFIFMFVYVMHILVEKIWALKRWTFIITLKYSLFFDDLKF